MRINQLSRAMVTLVTLTAVLAATASVAADSPYPIMRPDKETLAKWIDDYNSAAELSVDIAGMRDAPTSYSVLSHLDYITGDRNQASCGNCWAWAGTGCMEIAHDVENGVFDRLSVQYHNSNHAGGAGGNYACCGGWLSEFADFYRPVGFAIPWSNTNAQWQDGGTGCGGSTTVAGASIGTTPDYGITSIDEFRIATQGETQATAIANIKGALNADQGVWFGFFLADFNPFFSFWSNQPETAVWDFDPHMGGSYDNGNNPGGHAVLCVGYNDDDPDNSYWIMVNSWGTAGSRPNGIFRVEMDMNYSGQYTDLNAENGGYALYWQVLDVEFDNSAPDCDAGGPYSVQCTGAGTTVALDGSGSFDPNEDELTYAWSTDCPDTFITDSSSPTPSLVFNTIEVCPIDCTVSLTVSDGELSEECDAPVNVFDEIDPFLNAQADGGSVDENCEYVIPFDLTITDLCCVDVDNLGLSATATVEAGSANVGPVVINSTVQDTATQVIVNGTVPVSDVTECPAVIRLAFRANDCCGNTSDQLSVLADVVDEIPPTAECDAVGGEVDENCEYLMPFSATIDDNCCVDDDDVTVNVSLITGNATLGTPGVIKMQVGVDQVQVDGTVLVSDLTGCPATVQVTVNAFDCCGNPLVETCVATADVVDLIPPEITCPEPITLERGDKICNDDVQDWLDSTTATDNCDTDVDIVDDSADNGFECGFPFDSVTTVTWTATDDCGNESVCSSTITIKPPKRVDATKKGSVLIYPKVEIKWNAAGVVTQDTFVTILNDYPAPIFVHGYFVNGDAPLDAVYAGDPETLIERAHPGWNWVNYVTMMTGDEPTYFSALTGMPAGAQPFTSLDDEGGVLGRLDPDGPVGSRVLRGYIVVYAVDNFGHEITWNHLSGGAMIVNYADQAAWEYNAYAFQATCRDHGLQPLDCTLFDDNGTCCEAEVILGQLDSDGFQYDIAFDMLLFDFYAVGSNALSGAGTKAAPLPDIVTIDFETEDDLVTPLVNGQDISTPPEFGILYAITDAGAGHLGSAIFDSTPGGPNATGPDLDLLVGLGNLLILQDPDHPTQTVPGVFDTPDDDRSGGVIIFDFLTAVTPQSVDLVDINGDGQHVDITLVDAAGLERLYIVPGHWTNDITTAPVGYDTLDLTTLAPQTGEGGAIATASEDSGFDPTDVVQIVFDFLGSGAIDNIRVALPPPTRPPVMLDTDLTLLPVMMDLTQDTPGPVTTKAHFDIWNQNEDSFSGTTRCVTCWDQTFLSDYGMPNHFLLDNLQTDKGKARIDGVYSTMCEESENAPLLGVSWKVLAFSGATTTRAYAGMTLVGQGEEAGYILGDVMRPPGTLLDGGQNDHDSPGRTLRPTGWAPGESSKR